MTQFEISWPHHIVANLVSRLILTTSSAYIIDYPRRWSTDGEAPIAVGRTLSVAGKVVLATSRAGCLRVNNPCDGRTSAVARLSRVSTFRKRTNSDDICHSLTRLSNERDCEHLLSSRLVIFLIFQNFTGQTRHNAP